MCHVRKELEEQEKSANTWAGRDQQDLKLLGTDGEDERIERENEERWINLTEYASYYSPPQKAMENEHNKRQINMPRINVQ
jgi:hypothetical protein